MEALDGNAIGELNMGLMQRAREGVGVTIRPSFSPTSLSVLSVPVTAPRCESRELAP